jgi:capsular exopolysaccharide synthesis family protein
MITSGEPAEGKSLVAANLAATVAHGINEYVLLVDCDLRVPSLHKLFGLSPRMGLREYLENGDSIDPYLLKTPVEKLTLLPAGRPMPNPSELLGSDKMRSLIGEIKSRYHDRFLIFDATPTQFTTECNVLVPHTDVVFLVVRSGKTHRELAVETIQSIGREKILGVVFNATNDILKTYNRYYGYYQK